MSRFTGPFRRPPTALATVAVALVVGVGGAVIEAVASGARLSAARVVALAVAFAATSGALVIAGSGLAWSSRTAVWTHVRVGVLSALVLTWQLLDALHFGLFRRHVDEAALLLGYEAARSGALRVQPVDLAAGAAVFGVLAGLLTLAHAELSRLPCREPMESGLRRVGAAVVLAGLAGAVLHDRLWDERHRDAAEFARLLPWAPNASALGEVSTEVGWGSDQDARGAATLAALRPKLEQARLTARERPDLLIVHVESLRYDVLTEALMPRLHALGRECWVAPHHYSTGNNTGTSVFGLVTGLSGYFYPGARATPAPSLPFVVLRRLGYRSFVHFANNLASYDGVFDAVFRGAVDATFTPPDGPSDRMDAGVLDHYLGSLAEAEGPRLDYLVLDSTHYDYAYPPEFERHTPSGTLGLGVRDAVIVEKGINDRLRPRAQLVKNRYLNSVEWVDTLIGRLIDSLRQKGRWGKTWVAIVGDHGEAFWEHGTFGHGGGLEDEQVRVPFVLCGAPGSTIHYEYSSHADLMPTWLAAMGVRGVPAPFMSGRSLADYRPETDLAVTGMGITGRSFSRRYAVAGRGLKVLFDNAPRWPIVAAWDAQDRPLPAVPEGASTLLAEALGTKLLRSPAGEALGSSP
jgi:hypothetical protein